jgi:hypothetical protein
MPECKTTVEDVPDEGDKQFKKPKEDDPTESKLKKKV